VIKIYTLMTTPEGQRGQLDSENAERYPVQDVLLGGEYPAGRKPTPSKSGEVVEVSVQDTYSLGVEEYPAGRNPQPDSKT
jgi:hypothetical protein